MHLSFAFFEDLFFSVLTFRDPVLLRSVVRTEKIVECKW